MFFHDLPKPVVAASLNAGFVSNSSRVNVIRTNSKNLKIRKFFGGNLQKGFCSHAALRRKMRYKTFRRMKTDALDSSNITWPRLKTSSRLL